MGVFGTIGKIFTTAYSILKTAIPILSVFRQSIPEIDNVMDNLEDGLENVGNEADSYLDEHKETIEALALYSQKAEVLFAEIRFLCNDLLRFSQVESPDTITYAEAEVLYGRIASVRQRIAAVGGENADELMKALVSATAKVDQLKKAN